MIAFILKNYKIILGLVLVISLSLNGIFYFKIEALNEKNNSLMVELETTKKLLYDVNESIKTIHDNALKNNEVQIKLDNQIQKVDNIARKNLQITLEQAKKENNVVDMEASNEYKKLLKEIINN